MLKTSNYYDYINILKEHSYLIIYSQNVETNRNIKAFYFDICTFLSKLQNKLAKVRVIENLNKFKSLTQYLYVEH